LSKKHHSAGERNPQKNRRTGVNRPIGTVTDEPQESLLTAEDVYALCWSSVLTGGWGEDTGPCDAVLAHLGVPDRTRELVFELEHAVAVEPLPVRAAVLEEILVAYALNRPTGGGQ